MFLSGFEFSDEGDDVLAEEFDLLLEMQEAEQHEIDADLFQGEDAFGDLLGRADQIGLEAVIVLNEIL